MQVNRLYVRPDADTMNYLTALVSGSPVDLDLDDFKVEIMSTADALEYDPSRRYQAEAVNVNIFYDANLQRSSLIATLVSPDLQKRVQELREEGVTPAFYDWYIPYMPLKRGMPPLGKRIRTWKLQMANALVGNERLMTFSNEFVELEDLQYIPDMDYMEAMRNDLQLRLG